jgi:hypothetical protein
MSTTYTHSDYLPHGDQPFMTYVDNFTAVVERRGLSYYGVPTDVYNNVAMLRDDYRVRLLLAESPDSRTKGTIDDKTAAHTKLEAAFRQMVQQYFTHNTNLTPKDHDDLGLPIHDTKPTRVPVPTTRVIVKIELNGPGEIILHIRDDHEAKSSAKPFGVHGCEVCWIVSDVPITDWEQLTKSSFTTTSKLKLLFGSLERGKTIYFAARWENTRGEKGPWSEIQSAIIP